MKIIPSGSVDVVFADPPYRLSRGGVTVKSGKLAPVDKGAWDRSMGVGRPDAPQRIFMRPHDMSWAKHSHLPVRERSPNISLDGVMQDAAYLLRRIPLPRTSVNEWT